MDMAVLQRRLGMDENRALIRKAQELQRLSNLRFDSVSLGVGDICKSILCYELACTLLQIPLDRQKAIRISGLSEKAYSRSFITMQNALGLMPKLDVRELAVQFGCVRLIGLVNRAVTTYKERFIAALPEARRQNADFSRPVFTGVAFYLSARKYKLNVDKSKLVEICNTSDTEFASVATSMTDLCFDMLGAEKEKKDPRLIKGNRRLLDALPLKRHIEEDSASDSESLDDDDGLEVPGFKRSKKLEDKASYSAWKASVLKTMENKADQQGHQKKSKQMQLNFRPKPLDSVNLPTV